MKTALILIGLIRVKCAHQMSFVVVVLCHAKLQQQPEPEPERTSKVNGKVPNTERIK